MLTVPAISAPSGSVGRVWIDDEEPAIAEIADTGNEPVAEAVEHGKCRFGGAGGIGCVLMDFDGALVVKKTVEHVGRFAFGRLDHAGKEGGEAVGQEAIDRGTRPFSVFCIVVETGFAAPAGRKELPVRGWRLWPSPQTAAKGWACCASTSTAVAVA